jgi:hypothetical protein
MPPCGGLPDERLDAAMRLQGRTPEKVKIRV